MGRNVTDNKTNVSREDLHALFQSKGFQGPVKSPTFPGDLYYKRMDDHPVCLCNDKLQLCVTVHDTDFGNGNPPYRTVDFDVTGEYKSGSWAKVQVYSVFWHDALTRFDDLCGDALRAWDAMCSPRKS